MDENLLSDHDLASDGSQDDLTRNYFSDRTISRINRFAVKGWPAFSFVFIVSLVSLITIPILLSSLVSSGVRNNLILSDSNVDGFQQFKNQSYEADNYIDFYLFNITNPYDVIDGAKPILKEIGPFCYESVTTREDFEWNSQNDTLSYRESMQYYFNKNCTISRSKGQLSTDDVQITTINLLLTAIHAFLGNLVWHETCNLLPWKNSFDRLFTQRSARELISGYNERVILPINFPGLMPNLTKHKNPSWQKMTIIKVGERNTNDAREIVSWQGMNELKIQCPWRCSVFELFHDEAPCCRSILSNPVPVWNTKKYENVWDSDANAIHGRSGEQFMNSIVDGQDLVVFNDIVWRALLFRNFNGEKSDFKGIDMLRFRPVDTTFMNASEHPSNSRYYLFGPRGIFANLSMIQMGSDLYASLPHFLNGDPSLVSGVEGLLPDAEIHQMHIDVEPISGETMVEHVRAQVNGRIVRGVRCGLHHWFPSVIDNTYVPIAWFHIRSEITDEAVAKFTQIYTLQSIRKIWIILSSFLVLLCGIPVIYMLRMKSITKRQNHIYIHTDVGDNEFEPL